MVLTSGTNPARLSLELQFHTSAFACGVNLSTCSTLSADTTALVMTGTIAPAVSMTLAAFCVSLEHCLGQHQPVMFVQPGLHDYSKGTIDRHTHRELVAELAIRQ